MVCRVNVILIGREYVRLAAPAGEKKLRIVPDDLSEDERQYIWRNRKGKLIYTPIYEIYRDTFFEPILQEMGMKTAFAGFESTAVYEKYMLNAAQFAAAKGRAENELLKKAANMQDEGGKIKSFNDYRPVAEEITKQSRDIWLRVEYDTNRGNAVAGNQFARFVADSDLYGFWVYRGVMDARERPEHVALEGKIFRIGDHFGDAVFPRSGWNCRCDGEQVDGRYVQQYPGMLAEGDAARKLLEEHVDPQFRFNPYTQGTMPNGGHSYFEALGNANEANAQMFNLPPAVTEGKGKNLEGFAATDLHKVVNYVTKWENQYHVNKNGDLIFQNKGLSTNVVWNGRSLHAVQKHQRGIENLPATISHPDEVWGTWDNADRQQVANRAYLKFGKTCYLVLTTNGVIRDAYAVSPDGAEKYRKGVIL